MESACLPTSEGYGGGGGGRGIGGGDNWVSFSIPQTKSRVKDEKQASLWNLGHFPVAEQGPLVQAVGGCS